MAATPATGNLLIEAEETVEIASRASKSASEDYDSERSAALKTGSRSREATTQARPFALGVSISLAPRLGEALEC
jgi:hypothetical protein